MQVEPFFTAVPDLQLEAHQGFYVDIKHIGIYMHIHIYIYIISKYV